MGHVPEHWKTRNTSVPFILKGEGGVRGGGGGGGGGGVVGTDK